MVVPAVAVDDVTRQKLGTAGLAEVQRHLWPIDCQTCGKPLGDETPALCVDDLASMAVATLNHRACRAPEWFRGAARRSGEDHSSYNASAWWLAPVSGGALDIVLVLVNPMAEAAVLRRNGMAWRIASLDQFATVGFARARGKVDTSHGGADLDPNAPTFQARPRGVSAYIEGGHLVVSALAGSAWLVSANAEITATAHRRGEVLVGITTAVLPMQLADIGGVAALVAAKDAVFGLATMS